MVNLEQNWNDVSLVAFDLETTGKYPLSAEICEMAAVKYKGGKVEAYFETLIRPDAWMMQEVIDIHGITNEMVAHAPTIDHKIVDFLRFCEGSVLMAHHSPFDMGFLAWEFEKAKLQMPQEPVLCTSLLSRALIKESPNHKLITLAKTLGINPGNSHRALDDARTCLDVGLICLQRLGEDAWLTEAVSVQGQTLLWKDFSIEALTKNEASRIVVECIQNQLEVAIVYEGGSNPGKERVIFPSGVVRGPERDFIIALDPKEKVEKRYYLEKISSARKV